MKIEIEVEKPKKFADILTIGFVGGVGTSKISVYSGAYNLRLGTKFTLDKQGNLTQHKKGD